MANTKRKIGGEDTNITFEDQQQINTFARKSARIQELKDEIEQKKKELQNLEDAGDELMMLDDDTTPIPYRIGEIFIHLSSEETQEYLENAKSKIQDEIKSLESNTAEVKQLLADLKVKLYAKFGNNINLEAEEE
ncbi:prefoldin subunit 4-like [Pocillopora verrucosa]|uniref:prefoldin subunit 4-like n=1 Tax=Pocillopora damicornis TaxID=46731 RepID=UPI000F550E25|nr:prefoldin subunit 4-like [Pocillopora damicornis]XP_058967630.1 prefoldin subunit 4-like [Pocillopora verrucosa]